MAFLEQQVKLISPQFVRPFVKSSDVVAASKCEPASRQAMMFVTPKAEAQQKLSA